MLYTCMLLTFLHAISGYENIALNKPTHQSHEYIYKKYGTAPFDSSNAVDGLKTDLSAFGGQCVISGNGYNTATWWVNLTSIQSIHDIRIYYRTDNTPWDSLNGFATRFLGFYVYVSNTTNKVDGELCFHDTNYSRATIPAVLDIPCLVHGQYVIYYNERPQNSSYSSQYSPDAHNELCEVEVNGCNKTGYYGPTCSIPCRRNCCYCHIETGACQGCKPGYKGHNCEIQCNGGWYGQDCAHKCGACFGGDRQCHHVSGTCVEGCAAGFQGQLCKTKCLPGTFDRNCKGNCSQNCRIPGQCYARTGACKGGCQPGWEGPQCETVCIGRYGEKCSQVCKFCRNSACDPVDGFCSQGCTKGYQGPLCNEVCNAGFYGNNCKRECSLFCKTSRDCHHVTGYCKDGCIGGWRGAQCLQIEETGKWHSRFNGVLAALCISIGTILGLIFYIYIIKKRYRKRIREQNTSSNAGPVNIISGESGEVGEDTRKNYLYHKLAQSPFLSDL